VSSPVAALEVPDLEPAAQSRRMRWVFFPIAIAGIVTAMVLGVHAAHDRPDLSVSSAHVRRSGLTATVQVTVKNRSKSTLCPTIQIAARNRDGLDIDKVKAVPVDKAGKIGAGQTKGFKVEFTALTKSDYEKLDKFVGFVEDQHVC
jgi:hypothetical protein